MPFSLVRLRFPMFSLKKMKDCILYKRKKTTHIALPRRPNSNSSVYTRIIVSNFLKKSKTLTRQSMIRFAEKYSDHQGGDCIFWALAIQLTKLDISGWGGGTDLV